MDDFFMNYFFTVPTWLGCGVFTMWACVRQHLAERGSVKRRDLAFFLFLAAAGPLSLGAALGAIISVPKGFWEAQVWPPKRAWRSALMRDSGSHAKHRDTK